jgi:hypothetical protein
MGLGRRSIAMFLYQEVVDPMVSFRKHRYYNGIPPSLSPPSSSDNSLSPKNESVLPKV